MNDLKKHFLGETVKGIAAASFGAFLLLAGQMWFTNDIEYQVAAKPSYLSPLLSQQGLTMAFKGRPLKNVSVVEFAIFNRTQTQFHDVDLVFSVDESDARMVPISGAIVTPYGVPQSETVEELSTANPQVKKYRIKVLPKQKDPEFFRAVFVFEGDVAPRMSVLSTGKDSPALSEYRHWRDGFVFTAMMIGFSFLVASLVIFVASLYDYITGPVQHRKNVDRFGLCAEQLKKEGKLKVDDQQAIMDARRIYASFSRPKASKLWAKLLGEKKFVDE